MDQVHNLVALLELHMTVDDPASPVSAELTSMPFEVSADSSWTVLSTDSVVSTGKGWVLSVGILVSN